MYFCVYNFCLILKVVIRIFIELFCIYFIILFIILLEEFCLIIFCFVLLLWMYVFLRKLYLGMVLDSLFMIEFSVLAMIVFGISIIYKGSLYWLLLLYEVLKFEDGVGILEGGWWVFEEIVWWVLIFWYLSFKCVVMWKRSFVVRLVTLVLEVLNFFLVFDKLMIKFICVL